MKLLLTMGGFLAAITPAFAQTTGNDAVTKVAQETLLLSMVANAGWS